MARWPYPPAETGQGLYGAIALATLLGAGANALSISPVRALIWSAVLNAVVAVPVMFLIMRIGCSTKIMGAFKVKGISKNLGWIPTAVMAVASAAFFFSLAAPSS